MNIVHVLFDDYPYISSWGYQENKMAEIQSREGNNVSIVSGDYIPSVLSGYLTAEEMYNNIGIDQYGVNIIRLPLGKKKFNKINCKIKKYHGLYQTLVLLNPDSIFVHDLHSLSLFDIKKYKKKNPSCKIIADVHVNYINSARNSFSKYILHRGVYRSIIQANKNIFSKIYYLNEDSKRFIINEYRLNDNLEFLPLGGTLFEYSKITKIKQEYIIEQSIPEDTVIFLHSGKLNRLKKTINIMKSFSGIENDKYLLLIVGKVSEEIKIDFDKLLNKDKRIKYLGWKTSDELNYYLAVADVYLQPGSPSVTAHEAMCKRCATMINDSNGYYRSFIPNNAALYVDSDEDIYSVFELLNNDPSLIDQYKKNGYEVAKKIFDYHYQVKRL